MSIDINQYIEYLLFRMGKVSLRGIGTIKLLTTSAMFNKGKSELSPPKLSITFTEDHNGSNDLVELIAINESVSLTKAEKKVNAYAQSMLNNLLNYDIVKFGKIGFLEKKNSETVFTPSERLLRKEYYGLETLKLKPIPKQTKVVSSGFTQSSVVTSEHSGEWLNYLASLVLGALFVIAFHYFCDPYGAKSSTAGKSTDKTEFTKKAPVSEKSDLKEDVNLSSEGESQSSLTPIIDSLEFVEKNLQDSVMDRDNVIGNADIDKDFIVDNDLNDNPEFKEVDSSSISIAKPKKGQQCIILVAVYTKTIEALKMTDRIKAKGYRAFRDVKYDTHRVGVQFTCEERNPEEMIKEVRKIFGAKARYLYPQLSI